MSIIYTTVRLRPGVVQAATSNVPGHQERLVPRGTPHAAATGTGASRRPTAGRRCGPASKTSATPTRNAVEAATSDAWPPGVPCFTELRTPRPPGPGQADAPPLDDDADQPPRQVRLLPGTPWKPLPRMPGHQECLVSRNSARRGHRDRGKPTPHRWTTMRTSLQDKCDSYQERRGSRHLECLATRSALFHGTPHAAATGTGAGRRPTAGRRCGPAWKTSATPARNAVEAATSNAWPPEAPCFTELRTLRPPGPGQADARPLDDESGPPRKDKCDSDRKRRWKPPPRMPGYPGAPCSTWNIRTPRHRDRGTPTPTAGRRGGAGCKSVGRVATHPARRPLRLRCAPTNPPGVGAVLRPGLLAIP